MPQHDWIPSTLGHGDAMCRRCLTTNREAAAIGAMDECDVPEPASPQFEITWIDHGREPQVAPNPDFPNGKDIPNPYPLKPACKVELPYPAKRCGYYIVECLACETAVAISTAGRPDDPRSAHIPCKARAV